MSKLLKGLFGGQTLNQAHVTAILGNVVTAVVTFVPAWAPDKQIIIAALGGVVSNSYALAAPIHKAVTAIEGLVATHKITLANVGITAEQLVKSEIGKVDFNKLVQDVEQAHGVSASSVEALVEAKVRSLLGQLAAPPAPVAAPAAPVAAPIAPTG